MKRKHQVILEKIYSRPVSGTIAWRDIESLFVALGAEIQERELSRVSVFLFNEIHVFHRLLFPKTIYLNCPALESPIQVLHSLGIKMEEGVLSILMYANL